MANPTTNFGWVMPTNTDLVTDLPADFNVFGQAVDTSMADLKGGTTGQILSKASATDMDFTWIANDQGDITGVTATSPLTGGGTSGAITVGIQDATTSVKGSVQLSDSTSTTSSVLAATPTAVKSAYDLAASAYAPAFTNNFYAGKNKIINGDFGVWQRGTSFSNPASNAYLADRFFIGYDGTGITRTVSQQTFTAGTAPVAGYEGTYFLRDAQTVAGSGAGYHFIGQAIEDVRTFAGQTVTISFWAKADSAKGISVGGYQNFGSGGSSAIGLTTASFTLTTSWVRYTSTIAIPSIAGKTIGTSSFLRLDINLPINQTSTIDIWGVQLEAGSTATPFQTATGTKQGELAACQRYYFRQSASASNAYAVYGFGSATATTTMDAPIKLAQTMRVAPTAIEFSGLGVSADNATIISVSSATFVSGENGPDTSMVRFAATGLTQFRPYGVYSNNSATAYIGFSAEL